MLFISCCISKIILMKRNAFVQICINYWLDYSLSKVNKFYYKTFINFKVELIKFNSLKLSENISKRLWKLNLINNSKSYELNNFERFKFQISNYTIF